MVEEISLQITKDAVTPVELRPGYAEFCKHIFIPNFTEASVYYAPITADTIPLIESDYVARKDYELPVLRRSFSQGSSNARNIRPPEPNFWM